MATNYEPMTDAAITDHAYHVTDPASAPTGTVRLGSDEGLTVAAGGIDAVLTGTASYIDVTLSQFQVGAGAEYNVVYLVFNSANPTADLANVAVRRELHLENGRGMTRRYQFAAGTLVSMDYNPKVTSANISLNWEYR